MSERLHLEQFPLRVKLPVLWGDMDAFRHVNNTRFFRYMESARISYLEALNRAGAGGREEIGPILAETSCKFVSPLVYPDNVLIGCRTSAIRSTGELEQEYLLVSGASGNTVAVGWARIAAYDYHALQKAEFPQETLAAIREMEGVRL